jgi:hypothetical protein
MKKFFLIFAFLIFYSFGFANENLSKLNNLYLNGVLDKDTYFSSLKNLGVNIENDIFQNLFDLFSDKTLNQKNYEKSLSNLINLSNKKNDISDDKSKNDKIVSVSNSNSKSYSSAKCEGDIEACMFFNKDKIITFTYDDGVVNWSEELKNELIETEINFAKVAKETFSDIGDNRFESTFVILHKKGIFIKVIAEGELTDESFNVEKFSIRVDFDDEAVILLTEV